MGNIFLGIASVFAGIAVALGAFAAHGLKEILTEKSLQIWETGTKYQMYHALALLLVALFIFQKEIPPTSLIVAGYAFIIGIVIFSGSLYALSLTDLKILGAITPIGGIGFLIGWGCLVFTAVNN